MVIADPSSWAARRDRADRRASSLPEAVQGEFDRYVPDGAGSDQPRRDRPLDRAQPRRQLLRRHLVHRARRWWGVRHRQRLAGSASCPTAPLVPPNVVPDAVPGVTATAVADHGERLLGASGSGPASLTHPSQGNWRAIYTPGSPSVTAPNTVSTSGVTGTAGRLHAAARDASASRAGEWSSYPVCSSRSRRTGGPVVERDRPAHSLRVMGWSSRVRSSVVGGIGGASSASTAF